MTGDSSSSAAPVTKIRVSAPAPPSFICTGKQAFLGISPKGSPERCRFRFFPCFSVFFRFSRFHFLPFFVVLFRFCFLPFSSVPFSEKNGETPFARPLLRNPDFPRKWPRSLFRPVQARSWKERPGPGWDQDGPGWPPPRDLDGSEML